VTDSFAFCAREVPNWNTISISGYHIREAGSTAVQEVAFTLADAIAYVEAAIAAGLKVDEFAPRLSFFFNAHNNLLEEVAKFRAARRLWARLMRERFHARDPRSMMLRFHTQTAGSSLLAQQPEVNVVRTTIQALAAVLGGTQSLHTNAMDEALALPTEQAARLALRTQQVIAHESGVADTVDPLAGSYAVEELTGEIERRAGDYLDKIDALGGMLRAIETGYVQREIQDAAYRYQRAVETNEQTIVGLNRFQVEEETAVPTLRVDPAVEQAQVERVRHLRERRDAEQAEAALIQLEEAARGTENLLPRILACVEAEVTVGEISHRLRRVWGEYQEAVTV
jgi:methylmalonyl-CoA mutase N-terminal domain/subunit